MPILPKVVSFEWDSGNRGKNFLKHRVSDQECEEIFFDPAKRVLHDRLHSARERRFLVVGKTKRGRLLFVVFTIRSARTRVISARDLNKKEHKLYETKAEGPKI